MQTPPPKKNFDIPFSWVVIAILLYLLFQVCYIALKPRPHTVGESIHYDRTRLKK